MAEGPKLAAPRRGEIHLVSFDPTLGAEIKKTRPALVIQNDIGNRHSPITIVAAITSKVDENPDLLTWAAQPLDSTWAEGRRRAGNSH